MAKESVGIKEHTARFEVMQALTSHFSKDIIRHYFSGSPKRAIQCPSDQVMQTFVVSIQLNLQNRSCELEAFRKETVDLPYLSEDRISVEIAEKVRD